MSDNHPFDTDYLFDILRGVAVFSGSGVIANLAEAVARFPGAELSIAFNPKQVASKTWLRDALFETLGGNHARIWVLGGWYGVLSAFLLEDNRFSIEQILSFDLNPACAEVALALNAQMAGSGKFRAITANMEGLHYQEADAPSLVINTSCEHIANLGLALAPIPVGMPLVLQSNNYRREPDHVGCVDNLEAFEAQANLREVLFRGELATKNYTRFMLIGRR